MLARHASFELNNLWRTKTKDPSKWLTALSRLHEDVYQIKASTGKEVALGLHGLSQCPQRIQETDIFKSVANSMGARACVLVEHSMDEHSVALAGTAMIKLGLDETVSNFFREIPAKKFLRNTMKNPHNIAQIAHFIASADKGIPVAARVEALDTWVRECIEKFPPNRFKVKDIVQILRAYSKSQIALGEKLLDIMQDSIERQLPYMDHVAVSSILHSLDRLEVEVRVPVMEGLYATAAQNIGLFTPRSFFTFVKGSQLKNPTVNRIIREELPRIIPQFDSPSHLASLLKYISEEYPRDLAECIEKNWNHLSKFFSIESRESVIVSFLKSLKAANTDSSKWKAMAVGRLGKPRTTYKDLQYGISLFGLVQDQEFAGKNETLINLIEGVSRSHSPDLACHFIATIDRSSKIPDSILRILTHSDLKNISNNDLLNVGKRLVESLGELPDNVRHQVRARYTGSEEINEVVKWLLSEPVSLVDMGVYIYVFPDTVNPVRMSVPSAPPGYQPESTKKVFHLMNEIDPEFRLFLNDITVTVCGDTCTFSDISYTASQLLKCGGRGLIVPNSSSHELACRVMEAIRHIHSQ
jgi:hypothetical protein